MEELTLSLCEYKEILAAKHRIESAIIYMESCCYPDVAVIKAILSREVTPCDTKEYSKREGK